MPRLRCDRCGRDAIVHQRYSGLHLCGNHLQRDLVARAKRTIRAHGWIRSGDRIAVALSGGTSSSSLLHFLSAQFGMRRDLSLVAISVDEGTGPSRYMNLIERLAEGMGIGWVGTSFAEEFGGAPDAGNGPLPVLCRNVLRGHALTSLARRIGATKIALGTNLDDEARSVLLSVLRGEQERIPGCSPPGEDWIPRIRPFLRIPAEEVALYARLNLPGQEPQPSPHPRDPLESEVRRILDEYTNRHPAAPFSLVNLVEALQEQGVPEAGKPRPCEECRKLYAATCPAHRILDQVTGHG
ncbi:MAG: tRNA(Ile)-lysidine synthase [Methanomicrobiales archaeon]|nr:tRNA(Ile)-lysidine synthase [Methanomicrobiales archaeon]